MDNKTEWKWDESSDSLTESEFIVAHRKLSAGGTLVTFLLLAIFAAAYLLSCYLSSPAGGFSATPDSLVLLVLGAMNSFAVLEHHEYYRLLTATLLHGNLLHIALNGYALLIVGKFLEPLLGRGWFLFAFALGGLAGSLVGLKTNDSQVISIGASGAIMGLFAVLGMTSFRVPRGRIRTALRIDAIQVLIPSLIPLGLSIGGGKIDYAAHLGGAIGGVVAALFMFCFWKKGAIYPVRGTVAKVVGAVAIGIYAAACSSLFETQKENLKVLSRPAPSSPSQPKDVRER